jgi:hypothetical protein
MICGRQVESADTHVPSRAAHFGRMGCPRAVIVGVSAQLSVPFYRPVLTASSLNKETLGA